ncbi:MULTISPECIES: hypothetical protein [Streptomyces]|uniref:hypothetical protein n=1 Tax=Streptomyces lycopersici TaxID=2974589 RepID=UPI0021D013BB|nr:hypothetical protein [Streptomyces sp. NEAU-383]
MAAVAGAAIGALGAVGGGWLTVQGHSRQQRRQQQAEHRRWRDEVRRNAYNACLASAKELSAAWWKMSDRLWEEGSTPDQWQARFVEAHDAWTRFSTAVASVTVTKAATDKRIPDRAFQAAAREALGTED